MIAWVDGTWVGLDVQGGPRALLAVLDGRTGPGVFETMSAVEGDLPLWDRHLARMERGARRLGIPWDPPPILRRGALDTLTRNSQQNGVLRLTLVPMAPAWARWLAVARRRLPGDGRLKLLVVDDLSETHGPPRDVKCTARDFYDRALARATAAAADDALLLGPDGSVLETAVGNVFAWIDDRWATPAADGRFLPGVARAVLLDGLRAMGTPAVEKALTVEDLRQAPQLVVTNAVHGPRPATLLDPEVADHQSAGSQSHHGLSQLEFIWRQALTQA